MKKRNGSGLSTAIAAALIMFCGLSRAGQRTNFLTQGPGVAAAGMGDNFVAGGDDLSVLHYNPALLMTLDRSQLSGVHSVLFDGGRFNFIGWSQLFETSAMGLSATQLYRGNIETRQSISDTPGSAINSQIAITGGYARSWESWKTNFGANLKYIRLDIAGNQASAWASDVGASKRLYAWGSPTSHRVLVNSGINIRNFFSTNLTLKDDSEKFPAELHLGLSGAITLFPRYDKKKEEFGFDVVTLSPELAYSEQNSKLSVGLQYLLMDTVYFRLGWRNNLTTGIGIVWNDIQFDYAAIPGDYMVYHRVGIVYRFGKELERQAQPFVEEYQSSYQKAQRLYDRYNRDAAALAESRKYRSASDLLVRTIPLLPKENGNAVELNATCKRSLIAEQVSEFVSAARDYEARQDAPNAYKSYLNAVDVDPVDPNVKIFLMTSEQNVMPSVMGQINAARADYIQKISTQIASLLSGNRIAQAEFDLKKLQTVDARGRETQSLEKQIADLKQLYTQRILSQAIQNLQEDKPETAYQYFSEAERLNPKDMTIKDQKVLAQNMFLKSKKYTLKDKLYAEKLYYNAAIAFATNDNERLLENFEKLRNFNPVHDFIPELEEALVEQGLIKRRLP